MKILFDQGTPAPLKNFLPGQSVATAFEMGWNRLENGDLIRSAEAEGFQVLVTTDSNLKYQQNLRDRKIAIVVLLSTSWPKIQARIGSVQETTSTVSAGLMPKSSSESA